MSEPRKKRVAVIGASGIGRHHAKWWALEGADVCAFVGTSRHSTKRTREVLTSLFDFRGRAYTDVNNMLVAERPDIVDVCSPPRVHYAHVKAALAAGCDVLCEKPFVYDAACSNDVLLEQARELAELAERGGKRLGICTQYVVGARILLELWEQLRPGTAIEHFHAHLESPAHGREPEPARVWIDLAPHLLSELQYIAPGSSIDFKTLKSKFVDYEALASFDVVRVSGERLACDLVCRNAVDPPRNVRHFKFNGIEFAVEGEKLENGQYGARIDTPEGHFMRQDMMHMLIGEFLKGSVVADARMAVTNLEWLLAILERVPR